MEGKKCEAEKPRTAKKPSRCGETKETTKMGKCKKTALWRSEAMEIES